MSNESIIVVGKLNVLLVEDNPIDALLTRRLLDKCAFVGHLSTANTVQTAIECLHSEEFGLILLDLGLPDADGFETFRMMQQHAPRLPIVVLSASDDEALALRTVELGAQDYLVKGSFDSNLLEHVIRYAYERHRSEAALRDSELTVRAVFDTSLDGMVILDDSGNLMECNVAACEMLGETKQELFGKHIREFADVEWNFSSEWKKFKRQGWSKGYFQLGSQTGNARSLEFTARANFLPQRHFALLRDITEKLAMESQLRQALKMESIGRLAGGVAHDFNNLLMVITSYSELMLERSKTDARLTGYAEHILKAASRGASLTQQLLAFSRKQPVNPTVLDLNELVIAAINVIKRLITPDIELLVQADPACPHTYADRTQIEQIVINLCLNAKDAMPGGGRLTVTNDTVLVPKRSATEIAATYVRLSVTDTGTGMSEQTKAHIFEPFFTTKKDGRGTGLGLSTVYGIVEQCKGFIEVKTSIGKGTTFEIFLPQVPRLNHVPEEAVGTPSRNGNEVILLVDDEEGIRKATAEFLSLKGYQVVECGCGAEAIQVAGKMTGIDCLISDVVMPGMKGTELAEQLLCLFPATRVLFMSGYQYGLKQAAWLGAWPGHAFLQKPFPLEQLAHSLRTLLDSPISSASSHKSLAGGP